MKKNRLATGLVMAAALLGATRATGQSIALLASPNRTVQLDLANRGGRLTVSVQAHGATALEPSPLSMTIDGTDLMDGAELVRTKQYAIDGSYPWYGAHSTALNRCKGARWTMKSPAGPFTIEARAFDDGVAFRFIVPAGPNGEARVPDEGSALVLPAGTTIWSHEMTGHYEGNYKQADVADLPAGQWAAPPVTGKLPGSQGYVCLTEANVLHYPGMAFQADGKRALVTRLGHAQPISYPYKLRYSPEDIARVTKPAEIDGEIRTPWRVVLTARDLNELVNSTVIPSLCAPPDKELFPNGIFTNWIRPGRAVWRYLDGGLPLEAEPAQAPATTGPTSRPRRDVTVAEMKLWTDAAANLGFEHNLLEGFWSRWPEADLKDLCDYSKERGVGIWVWEHSKQLRDPEARQAFFDMCQRTGVSGAKIDFFDHEGKETIDLYESILKEAAAHHLLLDFHGANKPTGLARTYPNSLVYEAVRGMESRIQNRAQHETTLPFTRLIAGPAEYTVVHFGDARRGDTTVAHQIASAAIFSAPLLTYAANPQKLLDSPALNVIKSVPAVWDETVVLQQSEIGKLAAFARRSGETWFLAVMNGPESTELHVPLTFLKDQENYSAVSVEDKDGNPAEISMKRFSANHADAVSMKLQAGGGRLIRFTTK